ncbi:hypothetical protein N7520_006865 [Penicillium odoratum]|uniref:uncharacterized protein n=1 Tax=Penicillium odoratum TaxID=1167516 RepID=UPI0025483E7F|nr:uncharacterized protein N7520_006865 [Penicillium odoratum]KAJ5759709.1 hypothetical protein N7520_006865 [Penicillium odoratum]
MDFSEVDPPDPHSRPPSLEVTEYFGPRILTGERRERKISATATLNPNVGTPIGVNAGVGSLSRNSDVIYASRWKFTGTRLTAETSAESKTRSSRCRRLVWHLEENKLEQQVFHHPTVHSAVAFLHDSKPFYLDLRIEAKMHRWRDRIKQSIVYPPRNRKSCTRSLIEPKKKLETGESFQKTVLNLEQTMVERNLHPVPEISDPKPIGSSSAGTYCEDQSEYTLKAFPSESLVALVEDIIGQKRPDLGHAESSVSVHSDSSSATLVQHAEIAKDVEKEPAPSVEDETSASPTNVPIVIPSSGSGQAPNPAYSANETLLFEFTLMFGHILRFLAALIRYLVMGLNGLHAILAKAGNEN